MQRSLPAPRSRTSSFRQSLAHHNPFYLLSAGCMLLACLLLSNTMTWSPIPLKQLLILIGTLHVYEILLVALAVLLLRRRGGRRDGTKLLVLEAFFLVDIGFLNSEVSQINYNVGVLVNAGVLLVAIVKLGVIFRALRIKWSSPAFTLCVGMVATLLALPLVLKHASNLRGGDLPQQTLYAAWWAAAGLAAMYGMLMRHQTLLAPLDAGSRRLVHILLILPLISLAAHLGTSHWVYEVPFSAPNAAPILLAWAVLLSAVSPAAMTRSDVRYLIGMLTGAAVLTTFTPSSRPLAQSWLGVSVTPLMITLAAAYVTNIYCLYLNRAKVLLPAGAAAAGVWAFGPAPSTVFDWSSRTWAGGSAAIAQVWAYSVAVVRRLIPQTQAAWGVISLVGAFLLLAIGAFVSLTKRPAEETVDV